MEIRKSEKASLENKKLLFVEIGLVVSLLITYLAFAQSIAFILFSKWIIMILYGESFVATIPVLRVLSLYFVF